MAAATGGVSSKGDGGDIGPAKVLSFIEQGFLANSGQCICEAIAEVQPRRMTALARIGVGLTCYRGMLHRDGLNLIPTR